MSERSKEKPNVVLLVADSLRRKNLQFYGYEKETAPFLEKMASSYTLVENYNSNSPWTVPAHASMFSGKLPSEHGTTSQNLFFEERNRMVKMFQEKGYRCGLFTENNLVTPALGFGQEFNEFKNLSGKQGEAWTEVWKNDSKYNSRFGKWLDFVKISAKNKDLESIRSLSLYLMEKLGLNPGEDFNSSFSKRTTSIIKDFMSEKEPFFVFANFTVTHYEYTFNEREKEAFLPNVSQDEVRELTKHGEFSEFIEEHGKLSQSELEVVEGAYNCSIRYVDSLIKELYENAPENTVFIVIGDHGEVIGEYSYKDKPIVEHHFGTFDELIEVPMIVFPLNADVEGLMSHVDLIDFLQSLIEDQRKFEFGKEVISEYYSRRGFNDGFGIELPEDFGKLYSRESFKIKSQNSEIEFSNNSSVENLPDREFDTDLIDKLPFVLETILEEKSLFNGEYSVTKD